MSTNKGVTPPSPRYHTLLLEFMAFFHEKPKPYPKEHEFLQDELTAITPDDICKWMYVKAFGTPCPGPDAKLTGAGSSSLEFMKKALSFYMPWKDNWNTEQGRGNPTRSQQVKDLLHRVAALGGKKKKEEGDDNGNKTIMAIPVVNSDGPHGLLERMQAQNTEFINMLSTMGSALRTFSRSVEQIKATLETNNIAIRHELARQQAFEDDEDVKDTSPVPDPEAMEEAVEPVRLPDIPAMEIEMREDVAQMAETLQEFRNTNILANPNRDDVRILSGVDGFCTFSSPSSGKQMDVPDGFDLPSVDLLRAWRHWIVGFPEFKLKNDQNEIVDTPIRPLRFVNTSDLPQSLKKKFKDGWKPILMSMQGDVAHMLDTTPLAAMDDKFVQDTYNAAMSALVEKAPGIFAESNSDKSNTWKVATWSRKIREQQLGQQQVRRRQEMGSVSPIKLEDRQQLYQHQPQPIVHAPQPQPPSLMVQLRPEEQLEAAEQPLNPGEQMMATGQNPPPEEMIATTTQASKPEEQIATAQTLKPGEQAAEQLPFNNGSVVDL